MTDPTLAPIYADGVKIETIVKALQDVENNAAGQRVASEERFWSTPAREQSSSTSDVFEVSFASPQKINYLGFLLANFPHDCVAQWWNVATATWESFTFQNSRTAAVKFSTFNSIPSVINPSLVPYVIHPQHYGAGHWKSFYTKVSPIETNQVRLILTRRSDGQAPADPFGRVLPYSLGVKDFDCGYIVESKQDVPRQAPKREVRGEKLSFGFSKDILGSNLEFALREHKAADLLNGGVWRSSPQPVHNSVVPLYVDVRDDFNQPQTIDRFFIDPLYTGPRLNLYYSNDDPSGDFEAADDPIGYPDVTQIDLSNLVDPAESGLVFSGPSGLSIPNKKVQFDPTKSFSVAMSIQPLFESTWGYLPQGLAGPNNSNGEVLPLFDNGVLKISVQVDPVTAQYAGIRFRSGNNYAEINQAFDKYQVLNIFAINDGGIIKVRLNETQDNIELSGQNTGAINIGGDSIFETPMWQLNQMSVKQSAMSDSDVDTFIANPSAYVQKSEFTQDDTNTTVNSLLRIHPSFQTEGAQSVSQFGIAGGPPNALSLIKWTPINRDFSLRRGFLEFEPTKAKYFKFEFTDLMAEPYEVVGDISKTTKFIPRMPGEDFNKSRLFIPKSSGHQGGSGVAIMNNVFSENIYQDSYRTDYLRQIFEPNSPYTSNEVIFSNNPDIAARLRQLGTYYNFMPWMTEPSRKQFTEAQIHNYDYQQVTFKQKIAYFTGLKALKAYRVDYSAPDDTARYNEYFLDDKFFDSGDWIHQEGVIISPESNGSISQAESVIFNSDKNVTGVQFAAIQSPASQLLGNPDFTNDATWDGYGDASVSISEELNSIFGQVLKVDRMSAASTTWDGMEDRFGTWDEVEAYGPTPFPPTWNDLQADPEGSDIGGVQYTESIDVEIGQRIYVAARIYNKTPLSVPVTIEVFHKDSGTVVSSESITVKGSNKTTEWFTGYVAGSAGFTTPYTWDDIEPTDWNTLEAQGTWNDIDHSAESLVGSLGVRLVQNDYARNTFYVDNISVFLDSIKWEFSNDGGFTYYEISNIKNDPRGIFMFPAVGNQLRWRVSSQSANARVAGLVIRPVYDVLPMGVPYRESIQFAGPNDSPYDHYPPILEDAWFKLWSKPVPQFWWLSQRKWINTSQTALNSSEVYADTYVDTY